MNGFFTGQKSICDLIDAESAKYAEGQCDLGFKREYRICNGEHHLELTVPDIFIRKNEQEPDEKQIIENFYKQIGKSQVEIDWLKKSSDPEFWSAGIVH